VGCTMLSHVCYLGTGNPGSSSVFPTCPVLGKVSVTRFYAESSFCGKSASADGTCEAESSLSSVGSSTQGSSSVSQSQVTTVSSEAESSLSSVGSGSSSVNPSQASPSSVGSGTQGSSSVNHSQVTTVSSGKLGSKPVFWVAAIAACLMSFVI